MEYCICHGPEDGTVMIACSRKRSRCKGDSVRPQSADREWYHLQCVGLAEEPRGEWLCPACVAYAEEQALATQRRRDATKVATERAEAVLYALRSPAAAARGNNRHDESSDTPGAAWAAQLDPTEA